MKASIAWQLSPRSLLLQFIVNRGLQCSVIIIYLYKIAG